MLWQFRSIFYASSTRNRFLISPQKFPPSLEKYSIFLFCVSLKIMPHQSSSWGMFMQSKRSSVLIVDGSGEVREGLRDLFRLANIEANIAEDSTSALRFVSGTEGLSRPDLVILGQEFESSDRASFLRSLQADRPRAVPQTPVILFNTFAMPISGGGAGAPKSARVCRLSSVANLLTLVTGLLHKEASLQVS
jgi:CheY-like chemotaxis protein